MKSFFKLVNGIFADDLKSKLTVRVNRFRFIMLMNFLLLVKQNTTISVHQIPSLRLYMHGYIKVQEWPVLKVQFLVGFLQLPLFNELDTPVCRMTSSLGRVNTSFAFSLTAKGKIHAIDI